MIDGYLHRLAAQEARCRAVLGRLARACSGRRNLHDHHILFRSRGGDNTRDNRVTVCAGHHLHGIHAGHVRARGTAPDGITWELGLRPGREPLLRLAGDRYVGV